MCRWRKMPFTTCHLMAAWQPYLFIVHDPAWQMAVRAAQGGPVSAGARSASVPVAQCSDWMHPSFPAAGRSTGLPPTNHCGFGPAFMS